MLLFSCSVAEREYTIRYGTKLVDCTITGFSSCITSPENHTRQGTLEIRNTYRNNAPRNQRQNFHLGLSYVLRSSMKPLDMQASRVTMH